MEALSKAPGAETAVREGDKRRQSWGLGVAMGGSPPNTFSLRVDSEAGRGTEGASRALEEMLK